MKLILLFICLILSAFFSSSETAFNAPPRARLLHLVNTGYHKANLVSRLIQRPERLLATVLLGNNLVNTAAAALGTALAINLIGNDTAAVFATPIGASYNAPNTPIANTRASVFCGTSGSAPHVVGAAALVKQKEPALSPAGLRNSLSSQAIDLGAA